MSETEDKSKGSNNDDVERIVRHRMIQTKKSRWPLRVLLAFGIIVLLVLVGGGFYQMGKNQSNNDNTSDSTSSSQNENVQKNMQVKQIKRSVTGKSVEQDQKDALDAATKLINSSRTGSDSYEDRMKKISDGDFSSVTAGMSEHVQFTSAYKDNTTLKENAYNVLVGMEGKAFNNKEVSHGNDDWRQVYVHPELGVAFVPVSVYGEKGNQLPYTMEMVYVDGQWKLLPQSLVEAISFVGNSQSNSGSTTNPNTSNGN